MAGTKKNIEAIYRLSPMQEGILFHTLYAPDSGIYFEQYTCRLTGDLDHTAFERSWQSVIDRHAVLRSLITWEGRENPLQIVRHRVEPEWQRDDWRDLTPDVQRDRFAALLAADRQRGFVLDRAPLLRFGLYRTGDTEHHFVWSFHHVVLDGWSMRLVLDEVLRSYRIIESGADPSFGVARPYRDYIAWVHRQDVAPAEQYWRQLLSGFTTATPLRVEDRRSLSPWAERHSEERASLSEAVTTQLSAFARRHRLTLNTLVRGAWALVLNLYSGEDDVVFGATVSGRPPEFDGVEEMIGLFINTLPVRVSVPPDASTAEWLAGVQRQHAASSAYESVPLATIQGWGDVAHGRPLFDTLLVFENLPGVAGVAERGGLSVSDARYIERSNYPLAVLVVPDRELQFIVVYDDERFDRETIRRLAGHLCSVLQAMGENPARPLRDLPMLPEPERRRIIVEWNDTKRDDPADSCVHRLIEETARQNPEGPAVVCEHSDVSYALLVQRADDVARRLRALGVGPDTRVGICLERSIGMIVAVLGVLKAGGAYVPLDPRAPVERRRHVLRDTGAAALLTSATVDTDAEHASGGAVLPPAVYLAEDGTLDEQPPIHSDGRQELPDVSPANLAYVMYTSGSTGRPKGVAVTHGNLAHSTFARMTYYTEPVGSFLLLSPLVFDSSVAGIFWTLCQGGTLVLPGPRMEQDVRHLAQLIEKHRVTHVLGLPTLYDLLLEHASPASLASLESVMVAGEACSVDVVRRHFRVLPRTALYNEYGPTEATVWCTVYRVAPEGAWAKTGRVPIGRPIANMQAFILDAQGRHLPIGIPGELYVAGAGVARGYLDQPALTEERFVRHHVPGIGDTRSYRTGDIARFLPDGSIDLLGRVDNQVKIRGQRIELEEIAMVLQGHPAIREAVVTVGSRKAFEDVDPPVLIDALGSLDEQEARRLINDVALLSDDDVDALLAL